MKKLNDTMEARKIRNIAILMGCVLIAAIIAWNVSGGGIMSIFSGEKTVGRDIGSEEITDFYYTYSSSTYPPDYQRYRFYAENGQHYFYHEKREGDHWPLTEDDITVSGSKVLSDEEWNRFFGYLSGGTVKNRNEDVVDGDAGPWLYLYWKNDHGTMQEFAFASWNILKEFEQYCIDLMQPGY